MSNSRISANNQGYIAVIIEELKQACLDPKVVALVKLQIELVAEQAFIEGEIQQLREDS